APAEAVLAPRHVAFEQGEIDRQTGRQTGEERGEPGSMALAGRGEREASEHRRAGYQGQDGAGRDRQKMTGSTAKNLEYTPLSVPASYVGQVLPPSEDGASNPGQGSGSPREV